ncbi:PAS domain-containing protein [Actinomycetospora cinnamomea]|uniref:PAS domain-containing protein n=1 Tax=Actinomycetospora cinnamomea TaxID=663609 RepID=A0A2U1F6A7_9PSEU|nr:PAS domain-containing protein [Actinomycetospora cinnamomea]PVZ07715.1 PAS domain-containing protein [Actinomycetospora cinnamomea]
MITNHDLAVIPADTARAALSSARIAVTERVALRLTTHSLDRVQRVVLRLLARAGLSDPETRAALRAEADELDAAVRAARDVLFARPEGDDAVVATPGGPRGNGTRRVVPDHPVETALLDTAGTIVWVNPAWHEFCLANGGDPTRAGVGRSYLGLCDAASDPQSAAVAAAIRAALRGDLPAPARIEVPCPAPERPRCFDVLVSSRRDDRGAVLGATVTLSEVVPAETRTASDA